MQVHVPVCEHFVSQCKCSCSMFICGEYVYVAGLSCQVHTRITGGGQGVVCSSAAICHYAHPQLIEVKCVAKLGCAHGPFVVCCDVALLWLLTPPLPSSSCLKSPLSSCFQQIETIECCVFVNGTYVT